MNNQPPKRVFGSYISGVLQCIFGGAFTLGFGISAMVFAFAALEPVWAAVFGILTVLSAVLLWRGVRNLTLSSHCQRIQGIMAGKSREKLALIAQVTKQNYSQVVRELRLLSSKGYFPGGYVDLYRRDFVVRTGGPLPPYTPGDTVLREVKKKSVLPVYAIGAVWVFYAMVFPLYRWYHFAVAFAVALAVFIVLRRVIPEHTVIVEETRKVEPPPKPEAINTGNAELDEVLTTAMEYMAQLTSLANSITSDRIDGPVQELVHICKQIFDYIKKTPSKVRQIRQFMNYYLPTTIKLLKNYDELSREPVKGDNIKTAMTKIEGTMDSILTAFQKELDNLYQDKAMDISVDIEVMQNMMEQEGLGGDIFGSRTEPGQEKKDA